jgi:hypothetical protein
LCWEKPNVLFVRLAFTLTANGLGIAEGGDFFAQNFNRNTAVQILQKS